MAIGLLPGFKAAVPLRVQVQDQRQDKALYRHLAVVGADQLTDQEVLQQTPGRG